MGVRRRAVTARVAAAGVAAALALAGCGSGHPSGTATRGPQASDLYAAARRSAMSADSARVTGRSTQGGVTRTIDLQGNRAGTNVRVLLATPDDGSVEIRVVDGVTWLKGDRTYWAAQSGARVPDSVVGRFVRLPGDQAKASGLTLAGVLHDVFSRTELGSVDVLNAAVDTGTVDGGKAFVLSQRINGDGARMFVSADPRHDLLRVDGTKKNPGTLRFSQWNAVPEVTAPPAGQVAALPTR